MLEPGQCLGGYRIAAIIGRGGMGEVYSATQLSMDRQVAIKVLAPRLAKQDPSFAEKFIAEARAAGRLNHPNIVGVHDVSNTQAPAGCFGVAAGETIHYFSMELIDGETVKDVIERQGAIDLPTVSRIMMGMVEALNFAETHQIVHRDIKPDNIMLTADGRVKLADLGLALHMDSAEAISGSEKDEQGRAKVMGTPLYMSPEQARAQPVDHRSDQYSLGATLFHMLTGRAPYQGDSAKTIMRSHCFDPIPDPGTINPQVPSTWRELCMKLMAKLPADRFATAAQLRTTVKAIVQRKPLPSGRHRPSAGARSKTGLIVAAAAIVVLAIIAWFAISKDKSSPPSKGEPASQPTVTPTRPTQPIESPAQRLRNVLAQLPSEPTAALQALDKLANDPTHSSIAAELRAHRATLASAAEERRRQPLRAALQQAAQELDAGHLNAFRSKMSGLTPEPWMQDTITELHNRHRASEAQITNRISTMLDAAKQLGDCDLIQREIGATELSSAARTPLINRLQQRRQELTTVAKPPTVAASTDHTPWRNLSLNLERSRGVLPYGSFQEVCSAALSTFPDGDKQQIETLSTISSLAERTELALRLYIAQKQPKLECRVGERQGTFILRRLERDSVRYSLPNSQVEAECKRQLAVLPWRELINPALAANNTSEPDAELAFLWYWRSPEATAALARVATNPLARAIASYERRSRPLDITGVITTRAGLLEIAYPFAASKDPELLTAWNGPGLSIDERGLHWATEQTVARGATPDSALPAMTWKQRLRLPCTLEATVALDKADPLEAYAPLVLIGLASTDNVVRFGLRLQAPEGADENTKRQLNVGVFRTNPTSKNIEQSKLISGLPPLDDVTATIRLRMTIDRTGKIELRANDVLLDPIVPFTLPEDAQLTPIIQIRQFVKRGGLSISNLVITGRP